MSTAKHTPGPWKLSDPRYIRHDGNLELRLDIIAENKRPVVTLVFDLDTDAAGVAHSRLREGDPVTANIAAMLAAPELLEALEGLRYRDEPDRFCDHGAAPCARCDAARAAIKKARG